MRKRRTIKLLPHGNLREPSAHNSRFYLLLGSLSAASPLQSTAGQSLSHVLAAESPPASLIRQAVGSSPLPFCRLAIDSDSYTRSFTTLFPSFDNATHHLLACSAPDFPEGSSSFIVPLFHGCRPPPAKPQHHGVAGYSLPRRLLGTPTFSPLQIFPGAPTLDICRAPNLALLFCRSNGPSRPATSYSFKSYIPPRSPTP